MRSTLAAAIIALAFASTAHAQMSNDEILTPRFVPVKQPSATEPWRPAPTGGITPVVHLQPKAPVPQPRKPEDSQEPIVRLELPGPQRLFTRESEAQFFERLAQDIRKQPGARAIFPEEPTVSKQAVTRLPFPRRDPITRQPFALQEKSVEPFYVCHGRLYFEQPNFERAGWNFGVLQPAISLGTFYYDLALLPYHACSDLHNRYECSAGK